MQALHLLRIAAGGALLINALPHLVAGTSGRRFPTPFAHPPGRGLSSPSINVLWGAANLAAGDALLLAIGPFDPADPLQAAAFGLGLLLCGLALARSFGHLPDATTGEQA